MSDGHPLPSRGSAPHDGRAPVRRPAPGCGPAWTERGAVTAELAVAMPVVVFVLMGLLATVVASINQMRCIDAARAAARAAARNEPAASVVEIGRAVGPEDSRVTVTGSGDRVVVTVTADVRLPLPGHPVVRVESRAVAVREAGGELASALPGLGWLATGRHRERRRQPDRRPRATGRASTRRRRPRWPTEAGSNHTPAGRPPRSARLVGGRGGSRLHVRDRGVGTVLMLGLVSVLVILIGSLTLLGQVMSARHRAAAAADLAALAAAGMASEPGARHGRDPCAVAAEVSAGNGARLTSCALDGSGRATVRVRTITRTGDHMFQATAQARAGPAELETASD